MLSDLIDFTVSFLGSPETWLGFLVIVVGLLFGVWLNETLKTKGRG